MRRRARIIANSLGPGLITGAADDDPSGIATYSQGGAQFGAGLLWTLGFTTPLMIAIQLVSARIGWLTGKGLAASLRTLLPGWAAFGIVALLVVANTLNIAADVTAMGDALQLVSGLGEDGDARVLVLRDSDYQYDDHVGDEHEQPSLTAELKLKRDVHDFIVRAHAEKWP